MSVQVTFASFKIFQIIPIFLFPEMRTDLMASGSFGFAVCSNCVANVHRAKSVCDFPPFDTFLFEKNILSECCAFFLLQNKRSDQLMRYELWMDATMHRAFSLLLYFALNRKQSKHKTDSKHQLHNGDYSFCCGRFNWRCCGSLEKPEVNLPVWRCQRPKGFLITTTMHSSKVVVCSSIRTT